MTAFRRPQPRLPSRSAWLYAALLTGIFAVTLAAGYVYQYEPPRDRVSLAVDTTSALTTHRVVAGTVLEAADGRLVIDRDGERVEIALPDGLPIEDLTRAADLAPGLEVNVGAEQTEFGLVFTGVIAIEHGRVEVAP